MSYSGTVLHRSIKSAPKDPSNEFQVGILVSRLPLPRIFIMRFTQIKMCLSLNKIHCVVLESQVTTQVDSRTLFFGAICRIVDGEELASITRILRKSHRGH